MFTLGIVKQKEKGKKEVSEGKEKQWNLALTSGILKAVHVSVRSWLLQGMPWLSFHTELQISSTKTPLFAHLSLLQDVLSVGGAVFESFLL